MPLLRFPSDRTVGSLDYIGAWSGAAGPVLATGEVSVPDDVDVQLHVDAVTGSRAMGDGSWEMSRSMAPVDLNFLRDLPPDALQSVTIDFATEESVDALSHLAPGLKHLVLASTGFSDAALRTVARLTHLTALQTWGNQFTDEGVQVLQELRGLERLYLEEASLSMVALEFVRQLPRLTDLGLQAVALSADDLLELRRTLPGVRVDQ